jgi:hypothetical protein
MKKVLPPYIPMYQPPNRSRYGAEETESDESSSSGLGNLIAFIVGCVAFVGFGFAIAAFVRPSPIIPIQQQQQPSNDTLTSQQIQTLIAEYLFNFTSTFYYNATYPQDIVANSFTATSQSEDPSITGKNAYFTGSVVIGGDLGTNIDLGLDNTFAGNVFVGGTTEFVGGTIADNITVTNQVTAGSLYTTGVATVGSVNIISSPLVKVNIEPLNVTVCAQKIMEIQMVTYQYNETFAPFLGKAVNVTSRGFNADQLAQVDSNYATWTTVQNGWKSVTVQTKRGPRTRLEAVTVPARAADHSRIVPDLVGTVQLLYQEIQQLKARIAVLGG